MRSTLSLLKVITSRRSISQTTTAMHINQDALRVVNEPSQARDEKRQKEVKEDGYGGGRGQGEVQ